MSSIHKFKNLVECQEQMPGIIADNADLRRYGGRCIIDTCVPDHAKYYYGDNDPVYVVIIPQLKWALHRNYYWPLEDWLYQNQPGGPGLCNLMYYICPLTGCVMLKDEQFAAEFFMLFADCDLNKKWF